MRVRWLPRATADLEAIASYIGADDPAAARRWVGKRRRRVQAMAATPFAGRAVPELDDPNLREVLVGTYRIVYRVRDGVIRVLTVFESHRLLRISHEDDG